MNLNRLVLACLLALGCLGPGCDVGPITPPPTDVADTDTGEADTEGIDSGSDEDMQNMWKCLICDDE